MDEDDMVRVMAGHDKESPGTVQRQIWQWFLSLGEQLFYNRNGDEYAVVQKQIKRIWQIVEQAKRNRGTEKGRAC